MSVAVNTLADSIRYITPVTIYCFYKKRDCHDKRTISNFVTHQHICRITFPTKLLRKCEKLFAGAYPILLLKVWMNKEP